MATDNRARSQQPTPAKTNWRTIHRRANVEMLFAEDIAKVAPLNVEIVQSGVARLKSIDGDRSSMKEMPWISFRGGRKKLGLNRGNCKVLETIFGSPYHEDWRGPITLVVIRTTYMDSKTKQRLETDAIRIAPEAPRGSREIADAGAAELPPPVAIEPTPDEAAEIAAMEREAAR